MIEIIALKRRIMYRKKNVHAKISRTYVKCLEDELTFEGVTPEIARQLKGLIHYWSTQNMYRMGLLMTDEVRAKIKRYMKEYAGMYYLSSVHRLSWKLRAAIRHLACILHIHKYKTR